MKGVSAETHGAECKALAAWAGFSSGNSLIDGSGAPPAAAGLRAVATLVTGLSTGSFLVTPSGAVGGSVGRASLDQKSAFALGSWAAKMALAVSESTVSAAGSGSGSAAAESTLASLAPLV